MEERICKVCGKQYPLEYFPKEHGRHRHVCYTCHAKHMREWRKKKGDKLQEETGIRYTESDKERGTRESARRRLVLKQETGKTYRSKRDAEERRAYQREYNKAHKDDPKFKESQRKGGKRYWERMRMKKEIDELGEFLCNDFFD